MSSAISESKSGGGKLGSTVGSPNSFSQGIFDDVLYIFMTK